LANFTASEIYNLVVILMAIVQDEKYEYSYKELIIKYDSDGFYVEEDFRKLRVDPEYKCLR